MRATNYWQYDHYDVDAIQAFGDAKTELPEVQAAYITSAVSRSRTLAAPCARRGDQRQ